MGDAVTDRQFRFAAIVPNALINGMNNWVRNNIDPSGGNWLISKLSATGNAPATHGWFSAGLTVQEIKKMTSRLCVLAGISLPSNWDDMNKQQKMNWLVSQRNTINTNIGVYFQASNNDGVWDKSRLMLQAKGLQVITGV